jgi:hypothetical protein
MTMSIYIRTQTYSVHRAIPNVNLFSSAFLTRTLALRSATAALLVSSVTSINSAPMSTNFVAGLPFRCLIRIGFFGRVMRREFGTLLMKRFFFPSSVLCWISARFLTCWRMFGKIGSYNKILGRESAKKRMTHVGVLRYGFPVQPLVTISRSIPTFFFF